MADNKASGDTGVQVLTKDQQRTAELSAAATAHRNSMGRKPVVDNGVVEQAAPETPLTPGQRDALKTMAAVRALRAGQVYVDPDDVPVAPVRQETSAPVAEKIDSHAELKEALAKYGQVGLSEDMVVEDEAVEKPSEENAPAVDAAPQDAPSAEEVSPVADTATEEAPTTPEEEEPEAALKPLPAMPPRRARPQQAPSIVSPANPDQGPVDIMSSSRSPSVLDEEMFKKLTPSQVAFIGKVAGVKGWIKGVLGGGIVAAVAFTGFGLIPLAAVVAWKGYKRMKYGAVPKELGMDHSIKITADLNNPKKIDIMRVYQGDKNKMEIQLVDSPYRRVLVDVPSYHNKDKILRDPAAIVIMDDGKGGYKHGLVAIAIDGPVLQKLLDIRQGKEHVPAPIENEAPVELSDEAKKTRTALITAANIPEKITDEVFDLATKAVVANDPVLQKLENNERFMASLAKNLVAEHEKRGLDIPVELSQLATKYPATLLPPADMAAKSAVSAMMAGVAADNPADQEPLELSEDMAIKEEASAETPEKGTFPIPSILDPKSMLPNNGDLDVKIGPAAPKVEKRSSVNGFAMDALKGIPITFAKDPRNVGDVKLTITYSGLKGPKI